MGGEGWVKEEALKPRRHTGNFCDIDVCEIRSFVSIISFNKSQNAFLIRRDLTFHYQGHCLQCSLSYTIEHYKCTHVHISSHTKSILFSPMYYKHIISTIAIFLIITQFKYLCYTCYEQAVSLKRFIFTIQHWWRLYSVLGRSVSGGRIHP